MTREKSVGGDNRVHLALRFCGVGTVSGLATFLIAMEPSIRPRTVLLQATNGINYKLIMATLLLVQIYVKLVLQLKIKVN